LFLDRFLKRVVRDGTLEVKIGNGSLTRFGTPDGKRSSVVTIVDMATSRRIARNPVLGAAEAWMNGRLTVEGNDILGLLDLVLYNMRWDWDNKFRRALWSKTRWITGLMPRNDGSRAKANVAHHYDLSDRLYDLFLDADRQYSCAYFSNPTNNLEQAQDDKKAHIAAKLCLEPGQKVLDIGCGWGGLALYINRVAGVDVLGVTLSEEQLAVARKRAEDAGVSDRVKFELIDYRDVTGTFDRIVSVGMFEHVGRKRYQDFFDTIRDRLSPDGIALVHTIMRADGPGATDPFTARYIFPGGYCPALSEFLPHIEKAWLWVTDIEILRLHYGYTLEHWYQRVLERKDQIISMYDERFYRMWTFYLASAITSFRHDGHCNAQVQLSRRRDAVPLTRDYILEVEKRYRAMG
jgi:cyclopropane-fatty-acyl-phospholipid synthase